VSKESQSSYKQIIKATSIFGGLQVISILISIVRSKFIAVLLGPIGIGISGMLTATLGILSGLTNFGLGTSAVRDISAAYESGNTKRISIVANVLNRWVWITGFLGMILTLVFSPWLSYLTFGNYDYTIAFLVLSITLLINQLNSGQLVVLQGSRKISLLAKAKLSGSIIGLFTTIPLYYIWGINGIVPALVIAAFTSLFTSYYFREKVYVEKIRLSKVRSIAEGKQMLKMGFLISMSGFMTLGFSYLVRLFISHEGSITEVGLYNAGFAIISTYVGLIFSAMGTDYYPRLCGVADDNQKINTLVNSQGEVAILIMGPIIMLFILFANWIIYILYSDKFIEIIEMMRWAILGMFFKASSWPIGYIILAKGDSKTFFKSEICAHSYTLILNILGYKFFGLMGLGLTFLISNILCYLQFYLIAYFKYGFKQQFTFLKIFSIQFILSIITMFLMHLKNESLLMYLFFISLAILSVFHSLRELDKQLQILKKYL